MLSAMFGPHNGRHFPKRAPLTALQKLHQTPRVGWRRTLLIVVKIDIHMSPLALPALHAPAPLAQSCIGIVAAIAPVGTMTAHIYVTGSCDPRCRCLMMICEAQRDIMRGKQIENAVVVPGCVAAFEGIAPPRRQHLEEARQAITISLEARRQLEQDRPEFGSEHLQTRPMSAIEFGQVSLSRFQCVMNLEAFHANTKFDGVRLRHSPTASSEGVR